MLKEYLDMSSLLSKPIDNEPLFLYLAISEYVASEALIIEKKESPVANITSAND